MSGSEASLPRIRTSNSVDSNDEKNFFDPGRIDSTDDATTGRNQKNGAHLFKNGDFESELAQLRLGSGSKSSQSEREREESPEEPNSGGKAKDYIHLKNYVGLSGPTTGDDNLADDLSSTRGSLISSLSSHSQEHSQSSPRTLDYGERKPSISSNDASEDGSTEHPAEAPSPHPQFQYSGEEKERMRLVFQQIFSCIMPSQVSATTIGSGLGNGSDHGGSVCRENVYYRERVKVSTTLPAAQTKFKDKTRLVQTIKFHQGAIWSMKFSPCGGFLCTAGQDMNVVVWCVGALPVDAQSSTEDDGNAKRTSPPTTAAGANEETNRRSFNRNDNKKYPFVDAVELKSFINPTPYRVLEGHTGDIIDIAWSKSKFILSASTDKTVCLWHVSRTECLQFFRHPDIVTAVEFHPAHDRYYISGCFDRKLRVWDIIPDGIVQEWTQTTDTITSICFSPDGKTVAGGLIQGKVFFYDLVDFDQLKYKTQMNCRNKGGKYSRGTKVTGMCYRQQNTAYADLDVDARTGQSRWRRQQNHQRPSSMQQAAQLLVSTNDSRLRLCRLDDYSLVCKYKGLKNKSMQIKASFSNDGGHVICGSEGGAAYIWNTLPKKKTTFTSMMTGNKNRNDGYESFPCTSGPDVATTVAIFAPVDSVLIHLLNNSQVLSTTLPHSSTAAQLPDDASHESTTPAPGASKPAATTRDSQSAAPRPESVRAAVDYSSRVVVTADYEGHLRVFFRLS
eukprot:CAMPEP_0184979556 /NCGR_PEP_ID=MMETSP1098-20130426/9800_1 /TAXON_ID=89044 /ORGANISM="Spumella elongata, Strain CCAP 955/1" /LENGTH=730 /DNA_ID=CAMNT_0027502877 /DNA_START=20 /DNA_END=2212 /DNA_ORIENTATION=+